MKEEEKKERRKEKMKILNGCLGYVPYGADRSEGQEESSERRLTMDWKKGNFLAENALFLTERALLWTEMAHLFFFWLKGHFFGTEKALFGLKGLFKTERAYLLTKKALLWTEMAILVTIRSLLVIEGTFLWPLTVWEKVISNFTKYHLILFWMMYFSFVYFSHTLTDW